MGVLLMGALWNRYFYSVISVSMKNMYRRPLDALDVCLLNILQQEGSLSVADVAARARQSTTTCWRETDSNLV